MFDRGLRLQLRPLLPGTIPPDGPPLVSLFTRHDDVVRWQSCVAKGARNIEIRGTHVGLLASGNVYATLAHALTGEYDEPGITWSGAVPATEDLVPSPP